MSTKVLKDKELQEYFDALFEMHGGAGWKKLLEDLERMKAIYRDVNTVDSNELLWFRKGQIDVLDQMLTHAERTEAGYGLALEEQEGEEGDEPTGGIAKVVK